MIAGILSISVMVVGICMYAFIIYRERDNIGMPEAILVGSILLLATYMIVKDTFLA